MAAVVSNQRTTFTIILLGNSGVGKTSVVRMFTEEAFATTHPSTIGVLSSSKRISYKGRSAKFVLNDTGGQEKFASLAPIYCRNADAVLLCYDLTDVQSFEKMDDWRQTKGIPEKAVMVVVGCKKDLVHQRKVTEDMISLKSEKFHKVSFFETSAKTNENITEIFWHLLTVLMPDEEEAANRTSICADENIILGRNSNSVSDSNEEKSNCCGISD